MQDNQKFIHVCSKTHRKQHFFYNDTLVQSITTYRKNGHCVRPRGCPGARADFSVSREIHAPMGSPHYPVMDREVAQNLVPKLDRKTPSVTLSVYNFA